MKLEAWADEISRYLDDEVIEWICTFTDRPVLYLRLVAEGVVETRELLNEASHGSDVFRWGCPYCSTGGADVISIKRTYTVTSPPPSLFKAFRLAEQAA